MKRTIIVGLGNDILSDDAAGIHVARRLTPLLADNPDVDVVEATLAGLRMIEILAGYDRAVVVDAIKRPDEIPGKINRFKPEDFPPVTRLESFHDINLPTAVAMARQLEIDFPAVIEIITIGAADVLTISEEMMPEVEDAVNRVVEELFNRFSKPLTTESE